MWSLQLWSLFSIMAISMSMPQEHLDVINEEFETTTIMDFHFDEEEQADSGEKNKIRSR